MAPSTTRRRGTLPFHTSHTEVEADLLRRALGPNASVLEAGCGRTTRLTRFRDRIDRLAGVDLDESGGRMNESLDEFAVADLCGTLPFANATFDLVYSNFVVEHLERPPAAFAEWHRVLRPGGSVVVVTSNRSNPHMAAARVLPQGLRTAIKGRGPGAAARDVFPTRYRANTPGALTSQLGGAGFRPVEVVPVATLHRYAGDRRAAAAALRTFERGLPPRLRSTIVAWYRRD
ncbi:MAG: class I SAM-dependent methyltransferase [Gaiellales bacterium]